MLTGMNLMVLTLKHSAEELMSYLQVLDNMPPPTLEEGAPHEHEYVTEDPNILNDKLRGVLSCRYQKNTGKVVSGFKLPPMIKD
jgi:hypothetical protein